MRTRPRAVIIIPRPRKAKPNGVRVYLYAPRKRVDKRDEQNEKPNCRTLPPIRWYLRRYCETTYYCRPGRAPESELRRSYTITFTDYSSCSAYSIVSPIITGRPPPELGNHVSGALWLVTTPRIIISRGVSGGACIILYVIIIRSRAPCHYLSSRNIRRISRSLGTKYRM